jgi:hypothetical protein
MNERAIIVAQIAATLIAGDLADSNAGPNSFFQKDNKIDSEKAVGVASELLSEAEAACDGEEVVETPEEEETEEEGAEGDEGVNGDEDETEEGEGEEKPSGRKKKKKGGN